MPEIKKLRKKISEVEIEGIDEMWAVVEDGVMRKTYPTGLVVSIEDVRTYTPAAFEPTLDELDLAQDEFDTSIDDVSLETSEFSVDMDELEIEELDAEFTVKDIDYDIPDLSEFDVSLTEIETA